MDGEKARKNVADNVSRLREKMGLNAGQLSRRAGITMRTLFQIESQQRDARPFELALLATALGVSIDELVLGATWNPFE